MRHFIQGKFNEPLPKPVESLSRPHFSLCLPTNPPPAGRRYWKHYSTRDGLSQPRGQLTLNSELTRECSRNSISASSVHLVCRPREHPDGSLRQAEIGDWRDILS